MSKNNLKNHFLISSPQMIDPLFDKSVIYIYEHDTNGAKGLIINKSIEQIGFNEIIYRLSTRPEQRVGSDEDWSRAEKALADALDAKQVRRAVLVGLVACYMALRLADERFLTHTAEVVKLMIDKIESSELVITENRDPLEQLRRRVSHMSYRYEMLSDPYELYKAAVTLVFALEAQSLSSGADSASSGPLARLLHPKQSPLLMF